MKNYLEDYANKLKKGEIDALKNIYEILGKSVYLFAFSILRNQYDAEDILQNTFIKVKNNIEQYRSNTNFKNWILTIAKNFALNEYNRKNRFTEMKDDVLYISSNEKNFENKEILKKAIKILDIKERQIIMLYALKGFKHKEIAQIMKMPLGTVLWKYNVAIKKLKKEIGNE